MRGLKSTLLLGAVLVGLLGYIYFIDAGRPDREPQDVVFTVEADQIQEIRLTSGGETSVLTRRDGAWTMTAPVEADADETEATSLATNLAAITVNRVVDEQATDLAQYGLAPPRIEVGFTADGQTGQLAFGEKTATGADLYALRAGEHRVLLVPAFLETTFAKSPFDLRDKRILAFARDQADSMAIEAAGETIRMTRSGSTWSLEAPASARADYAAIEALLTRLSTTSMTSLLDASEAADLGALGLADPAVTITVGSGSSRATLVVGEERDGQVYARDEARGLVFTIDPSMATDLARGSEEYRDKDVFEFRPFNVDRLSLTRGDDIVTLAKTNRAGNEVWQLTRGSATTDVESARVEDLLSRLSGMRADSFAATADGTGLDQPQLIVEANYDGGTLERVRLARNAGQAFAAREGEPGAARLPLPALEDALGAIDALQQVPADGPPPPQP